MGLHPKEDRWFVKKLIELYDVDAVVPDTRTLCSVFDCCRRDSGYEEVS